MKRIGIVTYHSADNYGAVLQSFALSKHLHSIGVSCEIINYMCPAVEIQYKFRSRKKCFSWKNFFAHNLMCFFRIKKKKKFRTFRKLLTLSEICNRESVEEVAKKYDIFITGSDQVFNPICNKSDPTYFLDFVNKGRKLAFSASMGSIEQFELSKLDTLLLLSKFDSLSLREPDAAEYLSLKLGKKCETTMDPVWLLSREQWEEVIVHPVQKPYIFVYNLLDLKEVKDFAIKLSKQTGLPIISVSGTIMGDISYMFCSKNASNCSPTEFLGYIYDAEYVVTDSFHGTSFSILFGKKVFIGLNKKASNTNSRLFNILKKAGLENQIIGEEAIKQCKTEIEYDTVYNAMKADIENSKEYLKNVIS